MSLSPESLHQRWTFVLIQIERYSSTHERLHTKSTLVPTCIGFVRGVGVLHCWGSRLTRSTAGVDMFGDDVSQCHMERIEVDT